MQVTAAAAAAAQRSSHAYTDSEKQRLRWCSASLCVYADAQRQQQPDHAHTESVMQAAAAAQRVKHAYTIDEKELRALRPTLLKGFAFMQQQHRYARRLDLVLQQLSVLHMR